MYVLLVHYLRPVEEVDRFLDGHFAFLNACYQRGTFIVSGPRIERHLGGVILAKAASEEGLRSLIAEDPFVQQGLARYEIVSFRVTRRAPGFERFEE
jgi:uncharacterized protein YciI